MKRPAIQSAATRRWLLLGIGIVSILGLTLMNVYSLWQLHQVNLKNSEEAKRNVLRDVRMKVNQRMFSEIRESIPLLNMSQTEDFIRENRQLPDPLMDIIRNLGNDELFSNVYFTREVLPVCEIGGALQTFDRVTQSLVWVQDYPSVVCDGLEIVRSKTKTLLDGEYRWQLRTEFDDNRTVNIAIINPERQTVVGYISMQYNRSWLVENLITDALVEEFGPNSESGMTVWIYDWIRDEVIATNDMSVPYHDENITLKDRFAFDSWSIHAMVSESPSAVQAQFQFIINLLVLSSAVILLITSVFFIFRASTRERELAQRQAGFLANVTHELKTPLAVMQAAGENLADGRVSDPARLSRYGKHIHEEAVRLSGMIDKLLNVARSDAGEVVIQQEPVVLKDFVDDYLSSHHAYFTDRQFTVNFAANSPSPVLVDVESLRTILSNLVENAIKYSDKQKAVDIRVSENHGKVLLEVQDYGIGIPEAKQKLIFEKFYRVEDPMTAKTKGHGLGLSIVKYLTTLNGGTIDLQSTYGEGSTFMVQFPAWKAASKSASTNPSETQADYVVQG